MQATLTYAEELEDLVAADGETDAERAEGVAFYRTIAPLVAEVGGAECERPPRWGRGGAGCERPLPARRLQEQAVALPHTLHPAELNSACTLAGCTAAAPPW